LRRCNPYWYGIVPKSCESSAENSGQLPDRREPTEAIAVRRTALDGTILYPSCKRTWLKTAVRTVPKSYESSAENSGQLPDRREPTVAIAVRRTALDGTILYPSCKRTLLKTAVRRTPARNQAAERSDETDLFRWQVEVLIELPRPA
jgi:hypothetical protein